MTVALAALILAVPSTAGCQKTFTVPMATRAVHSTFYGVKPVGRRARRRLDHYERCLKNPAARGYVHGVRHRAWLAWRERRRLALERPTGFAVASYFDDSPGTACGFRAHFGVAHLSLPCGTRVRFWLGGRSAVAVVEDRGPAAWTGHTWDFNIPLANYMGLTDGRGIATVGYRIGG